MRICVYCSSSTQVGQVYVNAAHEFGTSLAEQGHSLVYGGGNIGLMGVVARSVHAVGGRVVGMIPHALRELELAYDACDELILTETMHERKAIMEDNADAF